MADEVSETSERPKKKPLQEESERCRCGHTSEHHMVSARLTYTVWRRFLVVLLGVSAAPIRVDFQCRVCKESFDFTVNPERLKKYI